MRKAAFVLCLLFITVFTYAAETFVIPIAPENDITSSAKTFNLDGIRVVADMTRPAVPFEPITFVLKFSDEVENLNLKFNMTMDMGEYSYSPKKVGGAYTAKATLPKCMMGGDTWFGKISFTYKGKEINKVFFFKVKK